MVVCLALGGPLHGQEIDIQGDTYSYADVTPPNISCRQLLDAPLECVSVHHYQYRVVTLQLPLQKSRQFLLPEDDIKCRSHDQWTACVIDYLCDTVRALGALMAQIKHTAGEDAGRMLLRKLLELTK